MKKILSVTLSLVLLLGLLPLAAGAETVTGTKTFSDAAQIRHEEAVQLLVGLGVIDGFPDGSYRPADKVSREQAVKMLDEIYEGGHFDATARDYTDRTNPFQDVSGDRWSANYIAYSAAHDVIEGYGDGRFGPEDTVTAAQLAKMCLVALHVTAEDASLQWPSNAMAFAARYGLFHDLDSLAAERELTREETAQMLYNMLLVNMQNKTVTTGHSFNAYEALDILALQYYFPGTALSGYAADAFGRPAVEITRDGATLLRIAEDPILSTATGGHDLREKLEAAGYAVKGQEYVNVVLNGTLVQRFKDKEKGQKKTTLPTYRRGTLLLDGAAGTFYTADTLEAVLEQMEAVYDRAGGRGIAIDIYDLDRDGLFDYVVIEDGYYATVTSSSAKKGTVTLELGAKTGVKTAEETARITVKPAAYPVLQEAAQGAGFLVYPQFTSTYTKAGEDNTQLDTAQALAIRPVAHVLTGKLERARIQSNSEEMAIDLGGSTYWLAENAGFHNRRGQYDAAVPDRWSKSAASMVYAVALDDNGYVLDVAERDGAAAQLFVESAGTAADAAGTTDARVVFPDGRQETVRVGSIQLAVGTAFLPAGRTFTATQLDQKLNQGAPLIPTGLYTYTEKDSVYRLVSAADASYMAGSLKEYDLDVTGNVTLRAAAEGADTVDALRANDTTVYLIREKDGYRASVGYRQAGSVEKARGYVIDTEGAYGKPDGYADVVVVVNDSAVSAAASDAVILLQKGQKTFVPGTDGYTDYSALQDGVPVTVRIPNVDGAAAPAPIPLQKAYAGLQYTTEDGRLVFAAKQDKAYPVTSLNDVDGIRMEDGVLLFTVDENVYRYTPAAGLVWAVDGEAVSQAEAMDAIEDKTGYVVQASSRTKQGRNSSGLPQAAFAEEGSDETTSDILVTGVYITLP